jgi:hypothetical protein
LNFWMPAVPEIKYACALSLRSYCIEKEKVAVFGGNWSSSHRKWNNPVERLKKGGKDYLWFLFQQIYLSPIVWTISSNLYTTIKYWFYRVRPDRGKVPRFPKCVWARGGDWRVKLAAHNHGVWRPNL